MNAVKSKSNTVTKLPSPEAAAKLIQIGCFSSSDFRLLCLGHGKFEGLERPPEVPYQPLVYYDEISSWQEFFDKGIAHLEKGGQIRSVVSLDNLTRLVHYHKISTKSAYREAVKSNALGVIAPREPESFYGEEFDWNTFLAPESGRFLDFEKARAVMKPYKLTNIVEWRKFCRDGKRPAGIPSIPPRAYEKQWVSWAHFLGAEDE